MSNLVYISYINAKTKATIQCNKCKFCWEIIPKNVTENTKCKMCSKKNKSLKLNYRNKSGENSGIKDMNYEDEIEDIEEYKSIKQILGANDLYSNDITLQSYPKYNSTFFDCVCNKCGYKLFINIDIINTGMICEYCEAVKPRLNKNRCDYFVSLHPDDIKLTHNIINPKTLEEPDLTSYIWSCEYGHHINRQLSNIKESFKNYGPKYWCYCCRKDSILESDILNDQVTIIKKRKVNIKIKK